MYKRLFSHPLLVFPFLSVVLLWPLSTQLLTVKNDALTYYYPVRTLIADALQTHSFPLWTQYINMGYPLHADMQSGAWSPVVWLFALLTRYSLTGFHLELLFYFSMAGAGMFYLGRSMRWSVQTAFAIGICYQFSGFLTDSVQFVPCLAAAAWLPWLLLHFRNLLLKATYSNAVYAGLLLCLMLTGTYPALVIICGYLLLAWFLFYFTIKEGSSFNWLMNRTLPLLLMLAVFFLLSLPAILSFYQHLPFIQRGQAQPIDFIQQNSLVPGSLVSWYSPFSTSATAPWLKTDPLMRNSFFGLIPLLFLWYGWKHRILRANPFNIFLLVLGLGFLLLAFGKFTFVHSLAYKWLPLLNTFRHPALFRLPALISFLLLSGNCMQHFQEHPHPHTLNRDLMRFILIIGAISVLILVFNFNEIFVVPDAAGFTLKSIFNQLSFVQRYVLDTLLCLGVLGILYRINQLKKLDRYLLLLILADVALHTQITLPVTIVGSRSKTSVEQIIRRNAVPFPMPALIPLEQLAQGSTDSLQVCGSYIPYRKLPTRNAYYITPGNLIRQDDFYESAIRKSLFKNPVLYMADTLVQLKDSLQFTGKAVAFLDAGTDLPRYQQPASSAITITRWTSNYIEAQVRSSNGGMLVLQQNAYPGWKVQADQVAVPTYPVNYCMQGVLLKAGPHTVSWNYQPSWLRAVQWIWGIGWLAMFSVALFSGVRSFFGKEQTGNTGGKAHSPEQGNFQ